MELNRYLERNVARHVMLTERFYYRAERRVSAFAEELGVDRNTVLSDVMALTALLAPFIAEHDRRRGTVLVRFKSDATLLELTQHVYRESNLLQLSLAYLTRPVDVAAFAGKRGLSVSAAYALNRRVADMMEAMGASLQRCRLVADELTLRYIAILVRSALGARPTALEAHFDAARRAVGRFEARCGISLTDLDRSFLRAAIGLALERGSHPLNESFLAVVADIPMQGFFENEIDIDGRRFSHQEALFISSMAACVVAKNQVASDSELARWVGADPAFADLFRRMELRFGPSICATELFGAALRRLYLFTRLGAATTAFTQDRPVPEAYRNALDDCRAIVAAWGAALGVRDSDVNSDLVSQFTLQVIPLIDRGPSPLPFGCAIVTRSELNRLTIATGIARDFPGTAQIVGRALPTPQEAAEELDALCASGPADAGVIVIDREYADVDSTFAKPYAVVGTSVVEAGRELPALIRQVLVERGRRL